MRRFDGTALYEHDDPRQGEHPGLGHADLQPRPPEVSGFLIANALYWLRELHVDGLRVDAVASMLLPRLQPQGREWIPNRLGGRENLEAIDFLQDAQHRRPRGSARRLHDRRGIDLVARRHGRRRRTAGLGFRFKWNMGWMHDTLKYFAVDPIGRTWHHDQITFAMVYEYSERFINPLSHDEVVHGKKSLAREDARDRSSSSSRTCRLLLAYMWTRPGKKLLFMGSELAPWWEWNEERGPEWHLAIEPFHRGVLRMRRRARRALSRARRAFGVATTTPPASSGSTASTARTRSSPTCAATATSISSSC